MTTTPAIVLSALKYSDTSLIVKVFSKDYGIITYMLKGVLSNKKGKLKPALFQPLTQLEITATHKNKGTLESMREAKVIQAYKSIPNNIVKSSVVMFLAEVLANAIPDQQKDEGLFNYLTYSLQWLEDKDTLGNYNILFLLNLSKYLGFYPDTSSNSYPFFDLQEGCFVAVANLNPCIDQEITPLFRQFLGINFDASVRIKTTKKHRQMLLHYLILYFELHLQGFKKPKSLQVLQAVYS